MAKKGSYQGKRHINKPYTPRKLYTVQEELQILKELEESDAPIPVFTRWKEITASTIQNWQNVYKT
jgi:hypothetical protein